MDDRVDLWVFREDVVQGLLVRNVHVVELRALSGDELDAVDDFLLRVVEVVDDDDIVVGLEQGKDCE